MEDEFDKKYEAYKAMRDYSQGNLKKMLESTVGIGSAICEVRDALEKRLEDTMKKIEGRAVEFTTLEECWDNYDMEIPIIHYQTRKDGGIQHELIVLKMWLTVKNIGNTFSPLFDYTFHMEGLSTENPGKTLTEVCESKYEFTIEEMNDLLQHIEKAIENKKVTLKD